jgi:hypothetical protein
MWHLTSMICHLTIDWRDVSTPSCNLASLRWELGRI